MSEKFDQISDLKGVVKSYKIRLELNDKQTTLAKQHAGTAVWHPLFWTVVFTKPGGNWNIKQDGTVAA